MPTLTRQRDSARDHAARAAERAARLTVRRASTGYGLHPDHWPASGNPTGPIPKENVRHLIAED